MKVFDSIQEMLDYKNTCPFCDKALVKFFASGKYDDIVNFGHKDSVDSFRLKKKHLFLNRTFKVEETEVRAEYNINTADQTISLKLTPSENELMEMFPIVKGFTDLEDHKLEFAMDNGLINIYKIVNRLQQPFFFIQSCENHFKRIHVMGFKQNQDELEEPEMYDEFYYVPSEQVKDGFYTIHDHRSPATKKERVIFIQQVKKDTMDNIDPKRGGMYLWEKKDHELMNFDFSDMKKLSRRVASIHALRG